MEANKHIEVTHYGEPGEVISRQVYQCSAEDYPTVLAELQGLGNAQVQDAGAEEGAVLVVPGFLSPGEDEDTPAKTKAKVKGKGKLPRE